jgi:hypothetical protein
MMVLVHLLISCFIPVFATYFVDLFSIICLAFKYTIIKFEKF